MANEQNLQPGNVNHTFTPSEAQKGGINSGIARKRRSICNKLLNNLITSEEAKEELKAKGLEDEMTELAYSMYDLLRTSRDKEKEKTSDRLKALEMFMGYADTEDTQTNDTPIVNINIIEDNKDLEKVFWSGNDETNKLE